MSELEELPSWAGRSTEDQAAAQRAAEETRATAAAPVQPSPRQGRSWRTPVFVLLGILALLGVGALGYFLADSSSGTETAASDTEDTAAEATDDSQLGSEEVIVDDSATADSEADDAAGSEDGQAAEDGDTVTVDVDETEDSEDAAAAEEATDDAEADPDAVSDADASGRQAIFRGGKVYLSGPVPSEEIGELIEGKAAAVVGPDNVVNEYVIDPTSTIEPGSSAPLYVEDVVLFEFNSISIAQPFLPILDLGTLLLRQNPQASVTVVTRTDAVGSEEVNLDVATKRAQAVINYWLGKGVSADQINADPRGEEGASEDDDPETAALNRRAEFIITGLLD